MAMEHVGEPDEPHVPGRVGAVVEGPPQALDGVVRVARDPPEERGQREEGPVGAILGGEEGEEEEEEEEEEEREECKSTHTSTCRFTHTQYAQCQHYTCTFTCTCTCTCTCTLH